MPTREAAWPAGTPCWVDYSATDIDGTKAFYTELFGWTYGGGQAEAAWTTYFATEDAEATVAAVVSAGGTIVADGDPLGGLGAHQDGKPSGWSTCFGVASAQDAVHSTLRAGGAVLTPIQNTPYGHFGVLTDPWNAPFSIMQLADA